MGNVSKEVETMNQKEILKTKNRKIFEMKNVFSGLIFWAQ